jgi:5-hydroxyisourate hydrolase
MSRITTHVLDTSRGRPASGLSVTLERVAPDGSAHPLGTGVTDADGRIADFGGASRPAPGRYRLRFDTAAWFAAEALRGFFPQVAIEFDIPEGGGHCHVPLLLSPYGYSTYRGS